MEAALYVKFSSEGVSIEAQVGTGEFFDPIGVNTSGGVPVVPWQDEPVSGFQ
jgi:hypothetical protein